MRIIAGYFALCAICFLIAAFIGGPHFWRVVLLGEGLINLIGFLLIVVGLWTNRERPQKEQML